MFVKTNYIMSQQINETKSLEIIHEMIDRAKNKASDNSVHYLLWGWAVLICSIAHYLLMRNGYEMPWIVWPIAMPLTGIAAAVIGAKQGKKKKHVSFMDKIMGYVWGGFVVTILIALVNGPKIGWDTSYSILIALYGLATFISGGLLKFKPLIYGGVIAWLISIVSFWVSMDTIVLLVGLSMITSYLIPGYMLRRSRHAS